jgi:16S rRNA (adenine1518-N6/adenine1519-N6)-dimethyltransferase
MEKRPYARRSLGQNFLHDNGIIRRIIDALEISANDTVVEIGPGRGALTKGLVESGANVSVVELDRELVPLLQEKFHSSSRFRAIEGDFLETKLEEILASPDIENGADLVKVVGNLPYYISTAILQKLIVERGMFSTAVVMLQKEVAERITATPENSERGFLTVLVEIAFEAERLFDVPPGAFRPVPKIWSSIVRLVPKPGSAVDDPAFIELVSRSFRQKRKTILNNLKHNLHAADEILRTAGIDSHRRAETISAEEWLRLFKITKEFATNSRWTM